MIQTVSVQIRVTSVRSSGSGGGAIFAGITEAGDYYVILCGYKIIRDRALVDKGQFWSVTGNLQYRSVTRQDGSPVLEKQINATSAELLQPSGENLIAWMARNCEGVALTKATKLYRTFPNLLDLLKAGDVHTLSEVVTPKTAQAVCDAFTKTRTAGVLLWLDQVGILQDIGQKVLEYYNEDAQAKIEANPYCLISFAAEWQHVDALAKKCFGILEDSPVRFEAAVEEALYGAMAEGHTCLPIHALKPRLGRLLGKTSLANQALDIIPKSTQYLRANNLYQATGPHLIEKYVADRLRGMTEGETVDGQQSFFGCLEYDASATTISINKFELTNFPLEHAQRQAIITCLANRFSLILGGAGTGKTTVLKALYQTLEATQDGLTIYQLALAGRAAQRMSQATGRESMTIAAFLKHIEPVQLSSNSVIVVDEVSMVDVILMHRLLRHIPAGARLILVGDPNQLPPIGPGLVLHALVGHPKIPQTELKVVRRQEASSGIPLVALAVRNHEVPCFADYPGIGFGVSFVDCNERELNDAVMQIYEDLGGNGKDNSVQILSSMRGRQGGIVHVNRLVHQRYSPQHEQIQFFNEQFGGLLGARTSDNIPLFVGDLVMFTRNDYLLGLRNGSLGKITKRVELDSDEAYSCEAEFEDKTYKLTAKHLNSLVHSYSITVHKSQGSQFRRVIIPVTWSRLLDQTLIYTAITRGVDQVVLVGDRRAAETAIAAPPSSAKRFVMLPSLLNVEQQLLMAV